MIEQDYFRYSATPKKTYSNKLTICDICVKEFPEKHI